MSASVYVADPVYTTATKSNVAASVTIFLNDDEWLQFGYLEGWYQRPSDGTWFEKTSPWVYFEHMKISTGVHELHVIQGVSTWSWHTFAIMFNSATWEWECWYDGSLRATAYWVVPTNGNMINAQAECFDTDDRTNGIIHFHDLKYLRYTVFKGGALRYPTWLPWDGYTSSGVEGPWSKFSSPNEFDCWINIPANTPPVAAFSWAKSDLTVNVDASASYDPDGTIIRYLWNWGDGTTTGPTTVKTASHTYASGGTYTIVLTVTDNLGGTGTKSQSVTVGQNQPPVARYTVSSSGLTVNVDASTSYDPDGSISTYAWSWGDGTTTGPTTVKTASHTYASGGTYTIVLTVTDNLGATDTESKSVTVSTTSFALTVTDNTPISATYPAEGIHWYPSGTVVHLSAEYMFESGNYRYTFRAWVIDGVSQGLGVIDIDLLMDASHTASAVYRASPYL